MRVQSKIVSRRYIICIFTVEESVSKMAHSHAWKVSAGCWQGTFISSPCRTLHRPKYLHDVAAVSVQSIWSKGELMPKLCRLLQPSLGRTYYHFRIVLDTQTNPDTVWKQTTQGVYTRRERSLGTIWEVCHKISEERPSAFQSIW